MILGVAPVGGGEKLAAAQEWANGPVSWLLQRWERRQLKRIRTEQELQEFVATFWWRRDPSPQTPGNPFSELFLERARQADLLFAEERVPGSLSDRGGALLLLGPPAAMHRGPRSALTVGIPHGADSAHRPLSRQTVEVWRYALDQLPAPVRDALGKVSEVELTFRVDEDGVTLVRGRDLLEDVAQAVVLRGRQ